MKKKKDERRPELTVEGIFSEMIETVRELTPKTRLPYGFGVAEYPIEQNRIRLIQYLRRHGRTADQITGFMNGCGQCRRKGEGIWCTRHVKYILRKNPVVMDLKGKQLPVYDKLLEIFGLQNAIGKKS